MSEVCPDCGAHEAQVHKPDCKQMERIRKGFGAVGRVKATGHRPPKKERAKRPKPEPIGLVRKKWTNPAMEETMWAHALYAVTADALEKGESTVDFAKVDALVLEWSKAPLAEMLEALS